MGDTGPGGGTVFYIASTTQSWGKYLEVSPKAAEIKTAWGCQTDNWTPEVSVSGTATAIGTGLANTAKIVAACTTSGIAAHVATVYRGGGKTDWFLPSKDELFALCKFARNQSSEVAARCSSNGVLSSNFSWDYYWSSTQISGAEMLANMEDFGGGWPGSGANKYGLHFARPVRAF